MNTKRGLITGLVVGLFLLGTVIVVIPGSGEATFTGGVTINADGSVTPANAPIKYNKKSYRLTDDIDGWILIKRSNIDVNGKGYTIKGDGNNFGIHLDEVNDVKVKNFYIYGASPGIKLDKSCRNDIKDNSITNCVDNPSTTSIEGGGITLYDYSNHNSIKENYLTGNYGGVSLWVQCSENVIKDNMVISNNFYGIVTDDSYKNIVKDNRVDNQGMMGIQFQRSANNIAKGNHVDGAFYYGISIFGGSGGHMVIDNEVKNIGFSGIMINSEWDIIVRENYLSDNLVGIGSWYARDNLIESNYVTRSLGAPGIYLDSVTGYLVKENEVVENTFGIYFHNQYPDFEMDNLVKCNLVKENGYGFFSEGSLASGNVIHHNNIIDNTIQVVEQGTNTWNDGKGEGNYWSDYAGSDTDGDGVGDTALPHNGVDYYPLMEEC